jgi:hypothetical protein
MTQHHHLEGQGAAILHMFSNRAWVELPMRATERTGSYLVRLPGAPNDIDTAAPSARSLRSDMDGMTKAVAVQLPPGEATQLASRIAVNAEVHLELPIRLATTP